MRDQALHFLLTHHDSEPAFAIGHDAILPLVGSAGEIGQVHKNGMPSFGLAAEPINATRALFDRAGVPIEIVMDHVTAVPMEVDAFTHNLTANQNIGKEWGVERPHEPAAHVAMRLPGCQLDVRKRQHRLLRLIVVLKFIRLNANATICVRSAASM